MDCKDCGNTTTVTSRSATAKFTYIKLVNRLVSSFLYRIYNTKTFPTTASKMMMECRIAKGILTLMDSAPCSDGVAEDVKKGCNQKLMVHYALKELYKTVLTV